LGDQEPANANANAKITAKAEIMSKANVMGKHHGQYDGKLIGQMII
jgi:hypothetical protein